MDGTDWSPGDVPHPSPLDEKERAEAGRRLHAAVDWERHFAPGELIRKRGDPCDGLHYIASGAANFYRPDGNGGEYLFHVGLPGFWFGVGELHSLGGTRTPLAADAIVPTRVRTLDVPTVEHLFHRDELVHRYLMSMLMNRYASLLDIAETGLKSKPEQRLATRLLGFARLNTVPEPLPARMDLPIAQNTLSALTGVSRQTVNRAVQHLQEIGAVKIVYGGIRILDFNRLLKASGGDVRPTRSVPRVRENERDGTAQKARTPRRRTPGRRLRTANDRAGGAASDRLADA